MDAHTATLFFRHNRPLRALMIEGQGWFCLQDLGLLLAIPFPERWIRRLDGDQHREHWVEAQGDWRKRVLVSECGAITMIVRSQIPENRAVRQWLTQEVIPALRATKPGTEPAITAMTWQGGPLNVLYWRDEPWIRLHDMPGVLPKEPARGRGRWWGLWQ